MQEVFVHVGEEEYAIWQGSKRKKNNIADLNATHAERIVKAVYVLTDTPILNVAIMAIDRDFGDIAGIN